MSHSPLKIVVPKLNQIERNVQQTISQHLKFIENFKNLNINDDTEESVSSGDYDRSPEKSPQKTFYEQLDININFALDKIAPFPSHNYSKTCKTELRDGYQIVRVDKRTNNRINNLPEVNWVDNKCFESNRDFYKFESDDTITIKIPKFDTFQQSCRDTFEWKTPIFLLFEVDDNSFICGFDKDAKGRVNDWFPFNDVKAINAWYEGEIRHIFLRGDFLMMTNDDKRRSLVTYKHMLLAFKNNDFEKGTSFGLDRPGWNNNVVLSTSIKVRRNNICPFSEKCINCVRRCKLEEFTLSKMTDKEFETRKYSKPLTEGQMIKFVQHIHEI